MTDKNQNTSLTQKQTTEIRKIGKYEEIPYYWNSPTETVEKLPQELLSKYFKTLHAELLKTQREVIEIRKQLSLIIGHESTSRTKPSS